MPPALYRAQIPCPLDAVEVFRRLQAQPGCVWLDSARTNAADNGSHSLIAIAPLRRLRLRADGVLEHIHYSYQGLAEAIDSTHGGNTAKDTCKTAYRTATETTEVLAGCDPLQVLAAMLRAPDVCLDANFSAGLCAALDQAAAKQTEAKKDTKASQRDASLPSADTITFFAQGCGAVGYFSYEFGRHWEAHSALPSPFPSFPLLDWGFYNCGISFDHENDAAYAVAASPHSEADAQAIAENLLHILLPHCGLSQAAQCQTEATGGHRPLHRQPDGDEPRQPLTSSSVSTSAAAAESASLQNPDQAQRSTAYISAVEKTRAYIASGDIYQVNIAQHFCAPLTEPVGDLYLRLRKLNPAPYAAFLDMGGHTILSSSPELFLRKRGQRISTRPIKGTRPRGHTPDEDAAHRKDLANSDKERAELLMIVDLERNDLGRVCETGTVRVDELYRIESYATVHHLVADISGILRPDTSLPELLRATFPGGSITGAPKIRAMQIIDEIEGRQRGIFCGSIGVLGFDGSIDLNIAIRTILCAPAEQVPTAIHRAPLTPEAAPENGTKAAPHHIHASFGAGLVWDSSPRHEYEETLHKAEALLKAIAAQGQ